MNPHTIPIALGARSYDVLIGAGLVARAGELIAPFAKSKRVFIVSDENVWRCHGAALTQSLTAAGLSVAMEAELPPGEMTKSFRWLEWLTGCLIDHGVERSDVIVAFGGGVIGDLAGLAAGLVKRGVDFVQIPTTLLAQVDSSVGGKTAIDTDQGKNMVGMFNQPRLVLADLDVLTTLPERELRAGYAEIVKIGLIEDAPFFDWCEANVAAVIGGDVGLAHAIRVAVAAKAAIVAADEREQGKRALLNLGHTFAHALEAHGEYGAALLHGEAVAAGCALAFDFAAAHNICPAADAQRVTTHLNAAGFLTDLRKLPGAPFDAQRLVQLMAADKKNEGGQLTLILPRAIGQAFVQKHADAAAVAAFLAQKTQA
ncbi:MAG: 3-dehydroquinate synthase [Terricaulis sp.]